MGEINRDLTKAYDAWYAKEIGVLGTPQYKAWFRPWVASRQSLEVKLTPPHNDYENYGDSYVEGAAKYYAQAKKAIEAVGLKVTCNGN